MKTIERSFRLEASEGLGGKPRPELIGPVLAHLHETLQDTVRMGFLHSSRARGRVPASLRLAADVRYLGHSADGDTATLLHFEVPSFGEAAADLYRQQSLWEDGPQPEQTAFELLGSALSDVAARCTDSSRFDSGLLRRFASYRRMFGRGHLNRIALPDTALPQPGQLDASVAEAAKTLFSATPAPRRVRVAGRLDVLGASQGVLKLDTGQGAIVTALWEGDVEALKDYFNKDVVIEGMAMFRPSGALLRVDATAIAAASARDEFFRVVPSGVLTQDFLRTARLRPGEKSAYARILGSIPAEETDEEFAAAVEAMS
ncbi:MAG: hypothetical protein Q8J99_06225 [Sulfuritalea sp.]|nr:hypothetical protein [Sulfuritalea sp.]